MDVAKRNKIAAGISWGIWLAILIAIWRYYPYLNNADRFDPAIPVYLFIGSIVALGVEKLIFRRKENKI